MYLLSTVLCEKWAHPIDQQPVYSGCVGHLSCFGMNYLWELPDFNDKKSLSSRVRINFKTAEVK